MNKDYRDAMDGLRFSAEAKERMARNLAAAPCREKSSDGRRGPSPSGERRPEAYAAPNGRPRWRLVAAVAAAVVLVLALGGGAYASGALMGVGNAMDDLFGGPPAQTEVAGKIGRPIGASATSAGVTITAEAIIGDRTNYAVVFSVAKDDGTAFEGIAPLDNGMLPLGFVGAPGIHVDGVTSAGGSGHFYDADPADNAIQYVEQMSVTADGGSIIGRTARVSLENLCALDEGGSRSVAEGTWSMKFEVNYEDTSVDLPAGLSFDLNGLGATLDSASISPLALTLDYTVGEALELKGQGDGRISDYNDNRLNRFLDPAIALNMKDGSVVELDAGKGAGGTQERGGSTACHKSVMFDEFLNVDEVASVTIGGTEIPLR